MLALAMRSHREPPGRLTWAVAVSAIALLALPSPYVLLDPQPRTCDAVTRVWLPLSKSVPLAVLFATGIVWLIRRPQGLAGPGSVL